MNERLKVHSNTVADFSRHLRREARKVKKKWENARDRNLDSQFSHFEKFQELANARKSDVKRESRAIYLARAFLDGRTYKSVENKRSDDNLFYNYVLYDVKDIIESYMDYDQYLEIGDVSYDELKAWADAEPKKSFWSNFKFW